MLGPRDWRDVPELFEAVASSLEDNPEFTVSARDERSPYGERGYIVLRTPDGRRFRLSLSEEC